MPLNKRLFVAFAALTAISVFNIKLIYSMKQQPETTKVVGQASMPKPEIKQSEIALIEQVVGQTLGRLTQKLEEIQGCASNAVFRSNESLALAHSSNNTAIDAFKLAKSCSESARQATEELDKCKVLQEKLEQQIPAVTAELGQQYDELSHALAAQFVEAKESMEAIAKKEKALDLEDKIKIALEKVKAKEVLGIYERQAEIQAQGAIDAGVSAAKENWRNLKEVLSDSKLMLKIVTTIVITVLLIYTIKYGIPQIIDYFKRPRIITETSKLGLFGSRKQVHDVEFNDLVFKPSLQSKLSDIILRVQSAKKCNTAYPNILFYGPSGIGKTAVAKALAYSSGLDYALTSGSEFAKIENLNDANNELRRLLNWANKSKGLIVFIDEAESLFANRKLSTTKKPTQDFINTFLSLISDQSQKNVMFIFATNHPFKIDAAITDRIGIKVEFYLPEATEREKILTTYLVKFAQDNEEAVVELSSEVVEMLQKYANQLEGFSPRAIKFVAETMILKARQYTKNKLTTDVAQSVVDEFKEGQNQLFLWKEQCDKWAGVEE